MTLSIKLIEGTQFGRWTVVDAQDVTIIKSDRPRLAVLCLCVCGTQRLVMKESLRCGASNSCGCLQREIASASSRKQQTTHGMTGTPTFRIWSGMLNRCSNPKANEYRYYGGKGIQVCERWLKFENFLADMGERPDGLTIDRLDSEKDYEPSNCRWATYSEQARHLRKLSGQQVRDIRLSLRAGMQQTDLAAKYGISKQVITNIKLRQSYVGIGEI